MPVIKENGARRVCEAFDGNKDVSELVFFRQANGVAAHYEYAPFGGVTATNSATPVTSHDFIALNPLRFSSEFADDTLGLVYYNYRHYEPMTGRWLTRDPMGERGGKNLYVFCGNDPILSFDILGLCCCGDCQVKAFLVSSPFVTGFRLISGAGKDFATISLNGIIGNIKDMAVDQVVDKYGSDDLKSIFAMGKHVLNRKQTIENIANFLVSSGFIFQPQLQMEVTIDYERRDCGRKWWQMRGDCNWGRWHKRSEQKDAWISPREDIFGEFGFNAGSLMQDWEEVLNKISQGIIKILTDFQDRDIVDIEEYQSKLKCEVLE